jgi:hypothetical protein
MRVESIIWSMPVGLYLQRSTNQKSLFILETRNPSPEPPPCFERENLIGKSKERTRMMMFNVKLHTSSIHRFFGDFFEY